MNKTSVEVRLFAFSTRSVVGMYLRDLDVCIGVPSEFPEHRVTVSATSSNGWDTIEVGVTATSSNEPGALPSREWAADHVVESAIEFLVSMQAT